MNKSTEIFFAKAVTKALKDEMAQNEKVVVFGEDVGKLGGVFTVTQGLQNEFGASRVWDTPLAESGIVGTAIGLAMGGFRPVVEIQFDGFIFPAFNQITTQLSRMHARYEGSLNMPVVIRIPSGGGVGAVEHHQESPESYFCHTPGLKVVMPSNPNDAYWMLRQSIQSNDPVLFMEPKKQYWKKSVVLPAPNASLHEARVLQTGDDCTVVSWGSEIASVLNANQIAGAQGVSLDIIDLRSLSPLDINPIIQSVNKTGRCVIVQEDFETASIGSHLAYLIQSKAFYSLRAPVQLVAGFDIPFPPARSENYFVPDADRILYAIEETLKY